MAAFSGTPLLATIVWATVCAAARAYLNIFDRHIFRKPETNFLRAVFENNLYAFAPCLLAVLILHGPAATGSALLQTGPMLVALLLQIVSYAFSHAFRTMPVRDVVIASTLANIVIAGALYVIHPGTGIRDLAFAALTVICIGPLLSGPHRLKTAPAAFIVLTLLVQSVVMEFWGFKSQRSFPSLTLFLPYLTALMFWRTALSGTLYAFAPKPRGQATSTPPWHINALRAALMLLNQAGFVICLSFGQPAYAWAILNATPLAAIVLSHLHLKEPFQRRDAISLSLLAASALLFTQIL